MTDGLLPEDRSEIAVVDDRRREPWFREPRGEYLCPKCGVWHRPYSAVGEAHRTLRADAIRKERTR